MNVDLAIAKICLRYAALAYVENTFPKNHTDTQGVVSPVASDLSAVVIAYRGSKEPLDYLRDARFLIKTPWMNGIATPHRARCHVGFTEGYFSTAQDIYEVAAGFERIYLTGHSLGGAECMQAALDLKQRGFPVTQVHTFGCPRVGNGAWRDLYNEHLHDVTFRWEAQGDAVPWLPPWLLNGYRHAGRECYLKNDGGYEIAAPLLARSRDVASILISPAEREQAALNLALFRPHHLENYERLFAKLA